MTWKSTLGKEICVSSLVQFVTVNPQQSCQCFSRDIGLSKLRDVIQMALFPRCVAIWTSLEWKCEGLVICDDMECTTFKQISEVLNSKINSLQLSIKCAIACFCWSLLKKNEVGCHCPSMYCCSTAPKAVLEASVMSVRTSQS